jgi:hypothetical protein
MDQERKLETPADDLTNKVARKTWHAPRFFVTDVIATNVMCGGGGAEPGVPNNSS